MRKVGTVHGSEKGDLDLDLVSEGPTRLLFRGSCDLLKTLDQLKSYTLEQDRRLDPRETVLVIEAGRCQYRKREATVLED